MTTAHRLESTVPTTAQPAPPIADRLERLPLERVALAVGTMALAAAMSLMVLDLPEMAEMKATAGALPTNTAQAPRAPDLSFTGVVTPQVPVADGSADALVPRF